ncbi:MAG: type IV secretion system DNA-binding domain-containing protein [Alcanivoracaceae bacterium]|nr:type IV secretion system DNA-binding domain-containing protein [Alcanivoracaceae bacterium]
MQSSKNSVTYLAKNNARLPHKKFGIKQADRLSHTYIIGKTGTGKSTLIKQMVLQDIKAGRGLCLIDPHGDLVESIYSQIPENRKEQVIYLNVPEVHQVYGYNPLRFVREDKRSLAASGMLEVFKKLWSDSWGARMEHILRNCILTLMEVPGSDLSDILKLLSDKEFRNSIAPGLQNKQVKYFWMQEFANYSHPFRLNAIAPIQNKVSAFLTDPNVRKILIAPEKDLSFRQIMDGEQILLVNLAKGQIGEDAAGLLGGLLVTTIALAAYSRQDTPEYQRADFYLYMDEFQNFTTLSIADMASELRKFHVGLILAHQYLNQLMPEIRDAVLGNSGTLIAFRLGAKDAYHIAREFAPKFSELDLITLPNYQFDLKLMIDGAPSKPFSGNGLICSD